MITTHLGPEDVYRHGKRMWETKYRDKYPHHATTPVLVDPATVPVRFGRFASVVMERGVRTWGFEHEKCRDAFVKEYGGTAI